MTFSQSSLSNSISAPHIPLPQHLTCWDLTLSTMTTDAARRRERGVESYRIDAGAEDAFVARGEAAGRLALLAGGAAKAHVIAGPLVSGKQLTPP